MEIEQGGPSQEDIKPRGNEELNLPEKNIGFSPRELAMLTSALSDNLVAITALLEGQTPKTFSERRGGSREELEDQKSILESIWNKIDK